MAGKRYSINYQDGEVVSVGVDGREFASVDDVADEDDRAELELLLGPGFDAEKVQAEVEASGAGLTRTLTWLFGIIGALALGFAGFSAVQGALSGQGTQSAWWILALILGLLGAAFSTATLLIWKAFGSTPKQG